MRFEDLDKKIKDAADQHHPPYDEKAWTRMAKLLNKHLPEAKEDNRRIIFLLLLLLFIGGGAFLIIAKPWSNKDHIAASQPAVSPVEKQSGTQPAGGKNDINNGVEKTSVPVSNSNPGSAITNDQAVTTVPVQTLNKPSSGKLKKDSEADFIVSQPAPVKKQKQQPAKHPVASSTKQNKQSEEDFNITTDNGSKEKAAKVTNNNNAAAAIADNPLPGNAIIKAEAVKTEEKQKEEEVKAEIKEESKPETKPEEIVKKDQKKKAQSKSSLDGLSFNFSVGPDVSKVGSSALGKVNLVYGAGIAYTKNRFTLRTGVYGVRKIYRASPDEYQQNYIPPYTKLESVDANCFVIEVPVKLSYNFGLKQSSNWFAGAGLSSYFMKSEKYDYIYKTNYGGVYPMHYEVKNKNKHYFSVLNLSAGYTRRVGKSVSVTAEPYVGIAMQGVGIGKVNLNSGGVLFTVGVHPFNSKTKNK